MNTPEELIPVIDWWQKEGKKTVAMCVVAGLVGLAVYMWFRREHTRDVEASAYAYGNQNCTMEELLKAADDYKDCDTAGMIKLRIAKMYEADGDYNKALEVYTVLVDEKSVPAVCASAPELGVARCNEALYKWAEAKAAYDSVAGSDQASSTSAFNAKVGSARCLAFSGGRDEALKILEEMKSSCAGEQMLIGVLDRNIDVVKRWQKREKPVPAIVAAPQSEVAKPAASLDVKASELTLPSVAPKAVNEKTETQKPEKAK